VFTKEELLTDLDAAARLSRAVINVNVAFQELRGEPVTTNFGPPRRWSGRGGADTPSPRSRGRLSAFAKAMADPPQL
jgi:hypothetical protein